MYSPSPFEHVKFIPRIPAILPILLNFFFFFFVFSFFFYIYIEMSPELGEHSSFLKSQHRGSVVSIVQDALPPPVHFESLRISDAQLKNCKSKKIRNFYEVCEDSCFFLLRKD